MSTRLLSICLCWDNDVALLGTAKKISCGARAREGAGCDQGLA